MKRPSVWRRPGRIEGLHTEAGGHYFNEGLAWPIEAEDKPVADPDDAVGWTLRTLLVVVSIFFALALYCGVRFPFS